MPRFLFLLLLFGGCVIGDPYPEWTPPSPPAAPLSVQDVIKFLKGGISEEAIAAKVRMDGIDARPTRAELRALREAGAGDTLLAVLQTAPLPSAPTVPPVPTKELEIHCWPPFHAFPGLWVHAGWYWRDGQGRPFPWLNEQPLPQ